MRLLQQNWMSIIVVYIIRAMLMHICIEWERCVHIDLLAVYTGVETNCMLYSYLFSFSVSDEQFSAELKSAGRFSLLSRKDYVWRRFSCQDGSFTARHALSGQYSEIFFLFLFYLASRSKSVNTDRTLQD